MVAMHIKNQLRLATMLLAGSLITTAVMLPAGLSAIARGYITTDAGLQSGMVVALSVNESANSTVERATQDNNNRVVGIVTTVDNSLVTVSSETAKVLVESEGQADAYVSDINGEVKQGDLLILSPLKGILMKYDDTRAAVIVIAADSPVSASVYSYQEGNQKKDTGIAKIKINLNRQGITNTSDPVPETTLSRLGRTLAGKDVNEVRVLIALVIFVVVLVAEGGIIYGAVSSAITALGRNPLAGKIIRGEMFRVALIALAVLLIGLGAIYGVLRI